MAASKVKSKQKKEKQIEISMRNDSAREGTAMKLKQALAVCTPSKPRLHLMPLLLRIVTCAKGFGSSTRTQRNLGAPYSLANPRLKYNMDTSSNQLVLECCSPPLNGPEMQRQVYEHLH